MRKMSILVLIAGVAGCSWDVAAPADETARELSFRFWELQSGTRFLVVETADQVYGCMNYQLHGTVARTGAVLEVTTPGTVEVSDICLTALGPARLQAPVALAAGEYELVFRNAGRTDRYELSVSDSEYTVRPVTQTFTQPAASRFPMTGTAPSQD